MLSGARRTAPPTTMMYTVRSRIKRISRWLGIARTSQPNRLISLTYTLIYSARTDLDADIPADIPGNAIRELADRLVEEARRAEEARLRLELSERARSTLEAELADERRRREETERERDELRQELEGLKLEVLRESREEAPESPKSPSPRFADWLFLASDALATRSTRPGHCP
jgi:chromosome segregation ATPase